MVNCLVRHGCDVNAFSAWGYTPLMKAKNGKVAKALIAHGADIDAEDGAGRRTLMHGLYNPEIAVALLEAGADINIKRHDGRTFTELAVRIGNLDVIDALVKRGADLRGVVFRLSLQAPAVKRLVEAGAVPEPMSLREASPETVRYLKTIGFDFNAADKRGRTGMARS